jgi:hypothetical protein
MTALPHSARRTSESISRSTVAATIERAGRLFEVCWNVLKPNKADERDGSRLIRVQKHIIDGQYILNQQYRSVAREKERLIAGKSTYNAAWFKRRMGQLDGYAKALVRAIGVGKALGDGYAWIFYQNQDDLIRKHLERQRQVFLPPGVGGIGEIAFVDKLQGLNRHFVLYHGITSFLRLGDVSFFSPETMTITSIGELKTSLISQDRYEIVLNCLYGDSFKIPEIPSDGKQRRASKSPPMTQKMRDRLNRQMREISNAFRAAQTTPEHVVSVITPRPVYFDELDGTISESRNSGYSYRIAGKSHVIGTVRLEGATFADRMLGEDGTDINPRVDPILSHASTLVDKSLSDNSAIISMIGYEPDGLPNVDTGTVPLFWWPLQKDNLYDLIFGNVISVSIYNPAHFWQLLRDNGFSVVTDSKGRFVSASRRHQGRLVKLQNIDRFVRLSGRFLLSDDALIVTIEKSIDLGANHAPSGPTRIDIVPTIKIVS